MGTNGGEDEVTEGSEHQDPTVLRGRRSELQFPIVLTLFQGGIVGEFRENVQIFA